MYIFKITVIKVILFRARTYFSKAAEAAPAGVDLDGLHLLLARFDLHGSGINVKTKIIRFSLSPTYLRVQCCPE